MSSDKKAFKKESGYEGIIKELKVQLSEQLRCLDYRADTHAALLFEIQDFFRRRSDVELEYSRGLEKLHKSLTQRQENLKQKRDQAALFSSLSAWQQLVQQTQTEARDRATLADLFATVVPQRVARLADDVSRVHKRCRQVCTDAHEELLRLVHELQTATKTYNTYYALFSTAEAKLQYVVNQKAKLEVNLPEDKLDKSRKFRLVEKEIVKRRNKYQDTRLQALRARNDYILCLEAANAAVHRFFVDDVPDTMDCADAGVYASLGRALLMAAEAQDGVVANQKQALDALRKAVASLDARLDKQRFIEANNASFMLPKKFEFVPSKGDIMSRYDVDPAILDETRLRYDALCRRIDALRTATDEQWKTMETAERSLLAMAGGAELDCRALFQPHAPARPPETALAKQRGDHIETSQFYVTKFAEYVSDSGLLSRLQVKRELLRSGLSEHAPELERPARAASRPRPRRPRLGRAPSDGLPRLFGGSLEEYLELSGQEIPLIIRSCVRVINLFGLHHQGIFRVSGSQVEINSFRDSFERGDDPLADVSDASDINSVAGVLKLYLRELREPFFPTQYFDQCMDIAQLSSADERTSRLRELVSALPHSVQVVMRYLFAFLSHLSEFSDENMMEPYNLAICFGPTLLPIPESKDQVQYQNLVNELMKHIILHHEEIFPRDGGPQYEKYISQRPEEAEEIGEAPAETAAGGGETEQHSEDDLVIKETERDLSLQIFGKAEQLEAVAQFDFTARSPRELSFHCGAVLTLYRQVSPDWWRGHYRGRDGLVPDKYIMLRIKDEDRTSYSSESGGPSRSVSISADSPSTPPVSGAGSGREGRVSRSSTLSCSSSCSQETAEAGRWPPERSATLPRGGAPTPAPRAASLAQLHRAERPEPRLERSERVDRAEDAERAAREERERAERHERLERERAERAERRERPAAGPRRRRSTDDVADAGSATLDATAAPEEERLCKSYTDGLRGTEERADAADKRGREPGDDLERAMREIAAVTARLKAGRLSPERDEEPPPPAPASARATPRRSVPAPAPPAAGGREPGSGGVSVGGGGGSDSEGGAQTEASPVSVLSRRALWETRAAEAAQRTPDLVLDLPAEWSPLQRSASGSSDGSSASSDGGGGAVTTAAETFARQNQCTVRRGGRLSPQLRSHPAPPPPAAGEGRVSPARPGGSPSLSRAAAPGGRPQPAPRPVSTPSVPAPPQVRPVARPGAGEPVSGEDEARLGSFRPQARVKPQPARKPSPKHRPGQKPQE